jgi:hypothetical protein
MDFGLKSRAQNATSAKLVSLAKIKSACEINNIQRHCVTCYIDENRLVRSFGEGQVLLPPFY